MIMSAVNRPVSERRNRRTHKNSRDGCPNCRLKRIKCSEELPECLNCSKRNLHCGYLDYTQERITQLQQKHKQRKEHEERERVRRASEPQIKFKPLVVDIPEIINTNLIDFKNNYVPMPTWSPLFQDSYYPFTPEYSYQPFVPLPIPNITTPIMNTIPIGPTIPNIISNNLSLNNMNITNCIQSPLKYTAPKSLPGAIYNPHTFIINEPRDKSRDNIIKYTHINHRIAFLYVMSSLLSQAGTNDLYFQCFMTSAIDGMINFANCKMEEMSFLNQTHDFYNQRLVGCLKPKSIKSYGILVNKLRSLIGDANVYETSVIVTLFIVWSSIINTSSNIEAISIFKSCCSNLVYQSLYRNENIQVNESLSMNLITELFRDSLNKSLVVCNRYDFKLLYEYGGYLTKFINQLENKLNDTNSLKMLFHLQNLNNYVLELTNYYIPLITEINNYNHLSMETKKELFYLSPRLAHEMLEKWIKCIPKDLDMTNSVDSIDPYHMVFHLFFKGMERVLTNVFPYLNCVAGFNYADFFYFFESVNFHKYDFKPGDFNSGIKNDSFIEFKKITNYILRLSNFLDKRGLILFHYLKNYNINNLGAMMNTKTDYIIKQNAYNTYQNRKAQEIDFTKTIVFQLKNKLGIMENQISSFSTTPIKIDNFPVNYEIFFSTPAPQQQQIDRRATEPILSHSFPDDSILLNFNYNTGLLYDDFDPVNLINQLKSFTLGNDEILSSWNFKRDIMGVFHTTRTEIMQTVN